MCEALLKFVGRFQYFGCLSRGCVSAVAFSSVLCRKSSLGKRSCAFLITAESFFFFIEKVLVLGQTSLGDV